MATRDDNTITKMIADAQAKLEEIKGVQYFGGDSLNLGQFQQVFEAPPPPSGSKAYAWLITMYPTLADYTMPLDTQVRPGRADSFGTGSVERVPTTDQTYQWLVYASNFSGDFPTVYTELTIIYSGQADFLVTQLA